MTNHPQCPSCQGLHDGRGEHCPICEKAIPVVEDPRFAHLATIEPPETVNYRQEVLRLRDEARRSIAAFEAEYGGFFGGIDPVTPTEGDTFEDRQIYILECAPGGRETLRRLTAEESARVRGATSPYEILVPGWYDRPQIDHGVSHGPTEADLYAEDKRRSRWLAAAFLFLLAVWIAFVWLGD